MPQIAPTEAETAALARAITRANGLAKSDTRVGIVAAIVMDDEVIAWGDNHVLAEDDPTRHAEMVAITNACEHLERTSLKGATLVTTLQPCEMCLSAMRFAGIERVVFAAQKANVAGKYFMFQGLEIGDFAKACDDAFGWSGGTMEADVLPLYADGQE
ncbi:hypothetical protein OCGS_1598 [Oceaniovalibus guishaninsula JLT2003]|uniref:CMP/dCMP-type deaminase domain-containing protein n=1 Tax=Oceaniovalibus guishaninsula JLT2003 TaxID=1231392 RepID=K2HBU0_9RHOB|nr:nucleoside deaminase [Oceaniovalibus guishaninsula]EKE44082.1 hypothetical protein OCGS_1598 [Oceaniovalibus guishaninsula JLT2003]